MSADYALARYNPTLRSRETQHWELGESRRKVSKLLSEKTIAQRRRRFESIRDWKEKVSSITRRVAVLDSYIGGFVSWNVKKSVADSRDVRERIHSKLRDCVRQVTSLERHLQDRRNDSKRKDRICQRLSQQAKESEAVFGAQQQQLRELKTQLETKLDAAEELIKNCHVGGTELHKLFLQRMDEIDKGIPDDEIDWSSYNMTGRDRDEQKERTLYAAKERIRQLNQKVRELNNLVAIYERRDKRATERMQKKLEMRVLDDTDVVEWIGIAATLHDEGVLDEHRSRRQPESEEEGEHRSRPSIDSSRRPISARAVVSSTRKRRSSFHDLVFEDAPIVGVKAGYVGLSVGEFQSMLQKSNLLWRTRRRGYSIIDRIVEANVHDLQQPEDDLVIGSIWSELKREEDDRLATEKRKVVLERENRSLKKAACEMEITIENLELTLEKLQTEKKALTRQVKILKRRLRSMASRPGSPATSRPASPDRNVSAPVSNPSDVELEETRQKYMKLRRERVHLKRELLSTKKQLRLKETENAKLRAAGSRPASANSQTSRPGTSDSRTSRPDSRQSEATGPLRSSGRPSSPHQSGISLEQTEEQTPADAAELQELKRQIEEERLTLKLEREMTREERKKTKRVKLRVEKERSRLEKAQAKSDDHHRRLVQDRRTLAVEKKKMKQRKLELGKQLLRFQRAQKVSAQDGERAAMSILESQQRRLQAKRRKLDSEIRNLEIEKREFGKQKRRLSARLRASRIARVGSGNSTGGSTDEIQIEIEPVDLVSNSETQSIASCPTDETPSITLSEGGLYDTDASSLDRLSLSDVESFGDVACFDGEEFPQQDARLLATPDLSPVDSVEDDLVSLDSSAVDSSDGSDVEVLVPMMTRPDVSDEFPQIVLHAPDPQKSSIVSRVDSPFVDHVEEEGGEQENGVLEQEVVGGEKVHQVEGVVRGYDGLLVVDDREEDSMSDYETLPRLRPRGGGSEENPMKISRLQPRFGKRRVHRRRRPPTPPVSSSDDGSELLNRPLESVGPVASSFSPKASAQAYRVFLRDQQRARPRPVFPGHGGNSSLSLRRVKELEKKHRRLIRQYEKLRGELQHQATRARRRENQMEQVIAFRLEQAVRKLRTHRASKAIQTAPVHFGELQVERIIDVIDETLRDPTDDFTEYFLKMHFEYALSKFGNQASPSSRQLRNPSFRSLEDYSSRRAATSHAARRPMGKNLDEDWPDLVGRYQDLRTSSSPRPLTAGVRSRDRIHPGDHPSLQPGITKKGCRLRQSRYVVGRTPLVVPMTHQVRLPRFQVKGKRGTPSRRE